MRDTGATIGVAYITVGFLELSILFAGPRGSTGDPGPLARIGTFSAPPRDGSDRRPPRVPGGSPSMVIPPAGSDPRGRCRGRLRMASTMDLFTPVHKGIRSMIYNLGGRLQTLDFSDPA